jgi:adenine-specific DNA-methyltransferase
VSRLTDLIAQAKAKDPLLGADLDREFKVLSSRLPFGLNFERHRPEAVELPQRSIRRGDKVRVLPKRGSMKKGDQRLWQVKAIRKAGDIKAADLELLGAMRLETQSIAVDDLVVVAEFRDTIYPGLVSTGRVQRGGDKPFHIVINGENFHVLKALTYTHRGKVDAIYIDPPYNTGAKDWKYNNDYVEGDDLYRHSKWLAMMERRLLVARELLNPSDSVLVVTIDEKEYLRLGLLLEQIFSEARIQMVSTVIKPEGTNRTGEFSRTNEFLYFVMFGTARVSPSSDDMTGRDKDEGENKIEWRNLRRRENTSIRTARPNQFYAVFVDPAKAGIHSVGDALTPDVDRATVPVPNGCYACFPLKPDGTEMLWGLTPDALRNLLKQGFARASKAELGPRKAVIQYLASGTVKAILSGEVKIMGRDAQGAVQGAFEEVTIMPKTTWNKDSHNAQTGGTLMLTALIPGRKFPFPKSLYAVEDSLRFFLNEKPDAVVLDYFSGSGTTAHAVMRLNRQDDGRRQCISVTNNEVAATEHEALRQEGLRPGGAGWEQHGICDYITKPRVAAAITGKTPDGEPIKGEYKFTDEFPMAEGFDENAEFFTLAYETPLSVNHNMAFARIAPLLWLRAGGRGKRIAELPAEGWAVVDAYGLLADVDAVTPFVKAVNKAKDLRVAYVVTDDDRRFQAIARRLPDGVEAVRLYESYLTNFSFANGE